MLMNPDFMLIDAIVQLADIVVTTPAALSVTTTLPRSMCSRVAASVRATTSSNFV